MIIRPILAICSLAHPLMALCNGGIPSEEMQSLYDEIATPCKQGLVMLPDKGKMIDNPCVYKTDNGWRMMYIVFDGKGYETHLAKSEDLFSWQELGTILARGNKGSWDSAQSDGGPSLFTTDWGGDNRMTKYRDRYWMTYIGGARTGYETAPLSIGVATSDDNTSAVPWQRMSPKPILGPNDADSRSFEDYELFRSFVVRDKTRRLGGEFVMYYNAKRRVDMGESIGMAISDDMATWRRYGSGPVVTNGEFGAPRRGSGIAGDPMITKIGDKYVMFYFSAFYPTKSTRAHETFAASKDLVTWTQWNGKPLIAPDRDFDHVHAHKPWVIKHEGIVYHFYCAVGDKGRAIALATSKPICR